VPPSHTVIDGPLVHRMKSAPTSAWSAFAGRITRFLANVVAHRTKSLVVLALAIGAVATVIVAIRPKFDSEVLDLLPKSFESVQGMKEYNNEFSNARQLVFGFLGEQGHGDDVEAFKAHFMSEIAKQPWVLRKFDSIPFDTQQGQIELQGVVPTLLFNLPADEFKDAMTLLQPREIAQRLGSIRDKMGGFDVKTQIDATIDPLGLLARSMKPLASGSFMDRGTLLASEDNLYQIAFVITNQPGLGAHECQEVMRQVNSFIDQTLAGWTDYKPRVYVTGRTAFVAQISKSMEWDATLSAVLSILIVSGLFYLAFRRLLPLIGICLILCLSAIVAVALGMLIFGGLNVIAIAFFSILVGLGVDFSLLLFGRYQQSRRGGASHPESVFVSVRDIGAAIFYVVCTTAIGFLILNLSKSSGFAQLGTLVALGVAFAGLFMVLFLFLFMRRVKPPLKADFMLRGTTSFVNAMFREPRFVLGGATIVLVIGAIVALTPFILLRIDTKPTSLQPQHIPASIALNVLSEKLKQESDPVMVLVNATDPQAFRDRWEKIDAALREAQSSGQLKSANTPLPFVLSPERVEQNRAVLKSIDLQQAETAVRQNLESNGFDPEAFQGVFQILNQLKAEQSKSGLPDWSKLFPQKSSWWFLLDNFFSSKPLSAVGYLRPVVPIQSQADQGKIGDLVHRADAKAIISGWSYTLWDLIPWATGELIMFTSLVAILILSLLAVVYRRFSLWAIHASALAFAMLGLVASLKLLHININLLNTLAFPLVLAIGVDYGIQFLVVSRREGDLKENLANVLKPLSICGLATFAGFAVLIPAQNPALSGLGTVCAIGVLWCLLTTYFYMVPAFAWVARRGE
jgi:predicted RND superfamily exporter protein